MLRIFLFIVLQLLPSTVLAEASADKKFENFLEELWEDRLRDSPEWATSIGDDRYNDRWSDVSLAFQKTAKEKTEKFFEKLQSINRASLSRKQQINYDLLRYQFENMIEGFDYPSEFLVFDQMGNWTNELPQTLKEMPQRNEKDLQNIIKRLKGVPLYIAQIEESLRAGLAQGITPPAVTLAPISQQFAKMVVKDENNPLLAVFRENSISIKKNLHDKYKKQALNVLEKEVLPKIQAFTEFYEKEYIPKARKTIGWSDLPNGKRWYQYRVKYFTTLDKSAEEIHQIGLTEVARIRSEMQKVLTKLKFKGSLEEFNDTLRNDPQHFFDDPEKLLAGYRDIAKRADPELMKLFGLLPRTPYGVLPIPEHQAPGSPTAYYQPGDLNAGRAGFFLANTSNLKARPKYEMEALTLHEAVPGHHLQLSLAREMENVPKFRRHYFSTAFIEGWGLYAESLGEMMGFYKDPYSKYGQLTYEMWRAIRLVVDTGLHTKGWSRDQAIEYFLKNSGKAKADVIAEVDRYIVWPGQALAYKIGELKIKSLRKEAEKRLGDKFDIRKFHDELLGQGALPLKVLESHMRAWMQEHKK